MTTAVRKKITIEATINAPVEKVWDLWTGPHHVIHWNNASEDWHTTWAENDLRTGGKFLSRMEARDGSAGFDFTGAYKEIHKHKRIEYVMGDGREVQILFEAKGTKTKVTETFDAEQTHTIELQQEGWQAILNNFKKYVEGSGRLELLHFEISINASAEKVYKTMLDEKQWTGWTSEFNPTSRYKGSWEKGSKILFLGTGPDGETGGMVSMIRENIPSRFISIEHMGVVHQDREVMSGPEVDQWAGALENYSFTETNGTTVLSVDTDSNHEFTSYFTETWPKALKKLKIICEG